MSPPADDNRITEITHEANIFLQRLLALKFDVGEVALTIASLIGQADAAYVLDGDFAEGVAKMGKDMAKSCAMPKVPYSK